MNGHLIRLRSRSGSVRHTAAPSHPRGAHLGAEQVAAALGNPVQTKLTLGAPDDAQEREADATADRVMRMPEGDATVQSGPEAVQRKCAQCEEEDAVQRKTADEEAEEEEVKTKPAGNAAGAGTVAADTAARIQARRGRGEALPAAERAFFEPRLSHDLSGVRVHADGAAAEMNRDLHARAFTVGSDVFFGRGEYRPGSPSGRHLMAHELTHVLQQDSTQRVSRKVDDVQVGSKRIDLYLSLGIYGSRATDGLASRWAGNIERLWSRTLKFNGESLDARMHVDGAAYPTLPDAQISHAAIDESNAVFVEANGYRSIVQPSCNWGIDDWSCGRWAADAKPMVVAHEAGHLMGLLDQYVDTAAGSVDKPGFETDVMANFWNDNGKTEFTRAWLGAIMYYYFGTRS